MESIIDNENFKIEKINDVNSKYVVVTIDNKQKYQDYQAEMITSTSNETCFLPIEIRKKDGEIKFYYDTASKVQLSRYLRMSKINKKVFLDIVIMFIKSLMECSEYLLSEKSIIIDNDYIYIDPKNNRLGLIYVPVEFEKDMDSLIKDFLIKLIMYSTRFEEGNDDYIQKMLQNLNEQSFTVAEFGKFLNNLRYGKINRDYHENSGLQEVRQNTMREDDFEPAKIESVQKQNKKEQSYIPLGRSNDVKISTQKQNDVFESFDIPGGKSFIDKPEKKKNVKSKVKNKDISSNSASVSIGGKYLIIGIAGQFVLVAAYATAIVLGVIDNINEDKVVGYGASFVITALVSFLMWRALYPKMKEESANRPPKEKKIKPSKKLVKKDKPVGMGDIKINDIGAIPKKADNNEVRPATNKGEDAQLLDRMETHFMQTNFIQDIYDKKNEKPENFNNDVNETINQAATEIIRNDFNQKFQSNMEDSIHERVDMIVEKIIDKRNDNNFAKDAENTIDEQQDNILNGRVESSLDREIVEPIIMDKDDMYYDETVFLPEINNLKSACMEFEDVGVTQRITITKKIFVVGRMRPAVDYAIDYNAMGRKHLEILQVGEKFYIRDLDSKNGTFINKSRINSNDTYEVRNGDIIALADLDFKFIIEE